MIPIYSAKLVLIYTNCASMAMKQLVVLLSLVALLIAADITTTNVDFAGSYQTVLSNLLTRVEKNVDVT